MRFLEAIIKFFTEMFSKKPKQVEETNMSDPGKERPKDLSEVIPKEDLNVPPPIPKVEAPVEEVKPKLSKEEVALEISSQFEGAGWGGVTGNFDGQGLSAGVLQWNFGQGSLQELLRHYISANGSLPEGVFPRDISHFANANNADAVRMSGIMQEKNKVKKIWKDAWSKFLSSPEGRAVQMTSAAPYFQKASSMANTAGMTSTKAFCFFFDIAVQNGSMKGVAPGEPKPEYIADILNGSKENSTLWKNVDLDNESQILLAMAWERAHKSHSRWVMDVFSRKGTIAVGQGTVHKKMRDLRDLLV